MAEPSSIAKYTALFGDDFAPIINALNNTLTPAVESQVLNIMDDLALRAEIFGKEIQRTVTRMGRQGASMEAIKTSLKRDMQTGGRIFSSLRNDVKEGIVEQINQSGRLGQMTQYKDANIFTWITVQGHKVCVDCSQRSGQTMSWDDWVAEGLPASGWSVCKGHCYCVLDPSGKIGSPVTAPTHVAEKGARAVTPTAWKPTMTANEASKWAAKSKVQKEIYHGTKKGAGKSIGKSGFDTKIQGTGSLYGEGVYGTADLNVAMQYGLGGDSLVLKYNLLNPLDLDAGLFWDWGRLATKDLKNLGFTQKLYRKYKFGIADKQLARWKPNSFHVKEGIDTVEKYVKYVKGTESYKRFRHRYSGGIDKSTGRVNVPDKVDILSKRFDNFLKDKYLKGDKDFMEMLKVLDEGQDIEDLFFKPEFGRLRSEFLKQQGYDGAIIRNARLPIDMNIAKEFDDYFIGFLKESVTVIGN